VVARAACKVAFGMDLPVSDFLGAFESELAGGFGADLAEQFVGLVDLEDTISVAPVGTAGQQVVPQAVAHGLVGDSLENLKSFIKKQRADSAGSLFIEHTDQMRLCDDAEGGRVWVSLRNVAKWSNPLQAPSAIPGLSDNNRPGDEKAVDPCAVGQVDAGGGLIAQCKDTRMGASRVGTSPVKPAPSPSGGCCVVS